MNCFYSIFSCLSHLGGVQQLNGPYHWDGLCQTGQLLDNFHPYPVEQNRYCMVQQSLTSHSTHYRSFRRRFYGSHNPTNSVITLKNDGQSTRSRANPTRLSSLKGKEKDVSKKNFSIYIAPLRPKTQRRLEDRELNQARSKPNTVNRPVRTARIFVHHCNSAQRQFLFIFPFLQTNITSQMWTTGGKGGGVCVEVALMMLLHDQLMTSIHVQCT